MSEYIPKMQKKVLLLGDGAVGKTSIRRRYMGRGFDTRHLMTMGADFSEKTVGLTYQGEEIRLAMQIWDLAGQETFKSVRARFLMNPDAAIIVFDLTRKSTFYNLFNWVNELKEVNTSIDIPAIIVGNKYDVYEDQITLEEIQGEFLRIRSAFPDLKLGKFLTTSAKTGFHIDDCFNHIIKKWLK